jgi:hypothetical protein
MVGPMLRAGTWRSVAGLTTVALLVGVCGAEIPAAASTLLPICFALLAAAAAFTLDEPASAVVDVTPTGPIGRTGIRAIALVIPLTAGSLALLLPAARGQALPWTATCLAHVGHVLLGFSAACVARTQTGQPGATTAAVVALALILPSLAPQVLRGVRSFPTPDAGTASSDLFWWIVLPVCMAAITVSVGGRRHVPLKGGCNARTPKRDRFSRRVPGPMGTR